MTKALLVIRVGLAELEVPVLLEVLDRLVLLVSKVQVETLVTRV